MRMGLLLNLELTICIDGLVSKPQESFVSSLP